MRRVDNSSSQDGVETTSITSSVENEVKRSAASSKSKRNSIKKKIHNFNDDSDDTVNEPLLQSDDNSEFNQSAKFVSSKSKTDSTKEKSDNTHIGTKVQKTSPTASTSFSGNATVKSVTTETVTASTSSTAPIHNYMNTNIFGVTDTTTPKSTKSKLIVEIDNTKSSAQGSIPLIFTTAKIHADNKTKEMEPLHITPVPILSTIEGNVIKSIPSTFDNSEKKFDTIKFSEEKEEPIIKNVQNIKEQSAAVGSKIKTTVLSTVPGQSTKQTSLDRTLLAQVDSKIPVICSKVDIINSTSASILKDEKTLTKAVDKTKKNVLEKSMAEPLKFENKQKPVKINNEKESISIDESQKDSNGVASQKVSLTANQAILTSNNSEKTSNKDKAPNSVSSFSMNKQLQRQKKTVEDFSISDAKDQSVDYDPKVNISQKESASLPENIAKRSISKTDMPRTSLQSQDVVRILSTKSSNGNNSALSDKPGFIHTVPKGIESTDKTSTVSSEPLGKGKIVDKAGPSVCQPTDTKNMSDKFGSLTSVPKGRATTSEKPESLTSIPTVKPKSADKSKTIKTSPSTSVPSGKGNNIDNSGCLNAGSSGKIKTTDKPASLPVDKTDSKEKQSSLTTVALSKANISNKPDSLGSVPSANPISTINPENVVSVISMKGKDTANITPKPRTLTSVSNEKVNTAGKHSSVKSKPQINTVISSSKTSTSVTKSGKKDPVTTTDGSIISKSANTAKSSGKESAVEVEKASEKHKPKILATLKSESPIAATDSKSNKDIPISATTKASSNVVTTIGNKKSATETHATSSSSATTVIKGSLVSSLPSSTSASTLTGTNKNIEPTFSENNKDRRA